MQHSSTNNQQATPADVATRESQQGQKTPDLYADDDFYYPGMEAPVAAPSSRGVTAPRPAERSEKIPESRERDAKGQKLTAPAPKPKPAGAGASLSKNQRRRLRQKEKKASPHSSVRAASHAMQKRAEGSFAPPAPAPVAPPAQNPPLQPVAQAPAPPTWTTVAANAAKYRVFVKRDTPAADTLSGLGVPTLADDEGDHHAPGGHPASAGVRKYLMVHAYAHLYAQGARKFLAVDGCKRDVDVVDFLNRNVDPKNHIKLTVYQDPRNAKMASRGLPQAVNTLGTIGAYQAYVFTDCFAFQGKPITPMRLYGIIGSSPAIWIGQHFDGAMGCVCHEGGWIRVRDGKGEAILHRSDISERARAPHDPLDWLARDGQFKLPSGGFLTWDVERGKGPMVSVYIKHLAEVADPALSVEQEKGHDWVTLPVPAVSSSRTWNSVSLAMCRWLPACFTSWLPQDLVLVDLRIQRQLKAQLTGRSFSAYAYRAACNSAATMVLSSDDYKLLTDLFPMRLPEILDATVWSAFLSNAAGKSYTAEAVNEIHGEDMERFNNAVSKLGVAPAGSPLHKWLFVLGATAGIGYVVYRYSAVISSRCVNPVVAMRKVLTSAPGLAPWAGKTAVDAVADSMWQAAGAVATWCQQRISHDVGNVVRATGDLMCASWRCVDGCFRLGMYRYDPLASGGWSDLALRVACEETVKGVSPYGHLWFPLLEFATKLLLMPELSTEAVLGASLGLTMHFGIAKLPWWQRCLVHLTYDATVFTLSGFLWSRAFLQNAPAMLPQWHLARTLWGSHVEQFYLEPWQSRGHWQPEDLTGLAPFSPKEGLLRREACAFYEQKALDPMMRISGTLPDDPEERASTYVYFILPTQIPVYAPGRTDANLRAVIEGRLCVLPPLSPHNQRVAWEEDDWLHSQLISQTHAAIVWEDWVDAWFAHVQPGFKRKRAARACAQLKDQGLLPSDKASISNDVFVKTDEVLLKIGECGVELKPRPVVNVDPLVQARAGPEIYAATERLHEEWAWTWQDRPGLFIGKHKELEIRLTFGSNATDVLLTEWMEEALSWHPQHGAWVLMAGDDSLVFLYHNGQLVAILEGDFSKYDQSQSWGPLLREMLILRSLGVSEEAVELLLRSALAKIVARGRHGDRVVIKHPGRPMRVTGGADTTIGNTINGVCCWVSVLVRLVWPASMREMMVRIRDLFSYYGFDLKLKILHQPTEASFLKGSWVQVKNRLYWAPAPSRILKLGKALSDPCVLYPDLDRKLAGEQFLNDVAASYRNFVQTPAVGAFVRRYYRRPARLDMFVTEPWKVMSAYPRTPGRPDDIGGLARRYELTEESLWELDALVEASSAYELIVHPALRALARVDYN